MTPARRAWLVIVCAMLGMAASGCSTQARRVNCESRLEPINRPAPAHEQRSSKVNDQAMR